MCSGHYRRTAAYMLAHGVETSLFVVSRVLLISTMLLCVELCDVNTVMDDHSSLSVFVFFP